MITRLGDKIAHKLVMSGTIPSEDAELYAYGFLLLLSKILYLVVTSILGAMLNIFGSSILFYLLFSVLREYAGGIHAKTEQGCMFGTILVLLLSIGGIRGMKHAELSSVAVVLLMIGCAVVFLLSPLDVPEKPLSADDRRYYRSISRRLAVAYAFIGAWAATADWPILYPLATAAALAGILLLAGTLNLQNAHPKNMK